MATLGTHSGTFQADEALGVWLLRQLPQYRDAPLTRSRDHATLGPLTIVIDVARLRRRMDYSLLKMNILRNFGNFWK